jgi:hypothetical protein
MSKQRAPIIHKHQMFAGEGTAEEIHARYGFPRGAKCMGCKRHPGVGGIAIRSFVSVSDLKTGDPEGYMVYLMMGEEKRAGVTVLMKGSSGEPVPYVRVMTVYACKTCRPAAESAAAKAPSYYITDINRGPGPDKPTQGWTYGSSGASAESTLAVERAVANMNEKVS